MVQFQTERVRPYRVVTGALPGSACDALGYLGQLVWDLHFP